MERIERLEIICKADQIAIDALKGEIATLKDALEQVKDYLQRNEHLLPDTQEVQELASLIMETLGGEKCIDTQ